MPSKEPIVYFRPFDLDQLTISNTSFLSKRKLRLRNYEQELEAAVKNLGTFVAIGKPGDKVPPLGAARMYVDDDNWHDTAKKLIKKAKLVFLHLDESEGVLWELEQTVKNLQPEKLILCLPLNKRRDKPDQEKYTKLRRKCASIFPSSLPKYVGDAQFIYFGKNWSPNILVPNKSKRSLDITNSDGGYLKDNLMQALKGLNRQFALAKTPLIYRHPTFWVVIIIIIFILSLQI